MSFEDDNIVPRDIFQDNNEGAQIVSSPTDNDDDNTTDTLPDPPQNYLPKGWVLFKTRGPMSMPITNRLDFFSNFYSDGKRNTKNGRKAFCEEEAKEKDAKRDFQFENSSITSSCELRGVGAENRKFVIRTAQRAAHLRNQQYEGEILKLNMVLKSKSGQRDALIQMVQLHNTLGDAEAAKLEMVKVTACMAEITTIEDRLLELENGANAMKGLGSVEEDTME